jgi:hypothetical protein
MSTINNTDLFLIARGTANYHVTAADVAAFTGGGGGSFVVQTVPTAPAGATANAVIPGGTTAQRQTTPAVVAGEFRYNTTDSLMEFYDGANWISLAAVSATTTFGLGLNVTGSLVKVGIPVQGAAPAVGAAAAQAVVGSLWFDSTKEMLRTWDGTNWIGTEPSNWQQAGAAPAARPDGTALQAGDTYYNTASIQTFAYNGTDWSPFDERRPVIVSAAYTAKANDYVVVDTATQTVTLPASPLPGTCVTVVVAGTWLDTVVARNGSNIMGLAQDITLDKQYAAMQFTYTDATNGWRLN